MIAFSFPEKAILRTFELCGYTKKELLAKLESSSILLNRYAQELFSSDLFTPSEKSECISAVELSVSDLGFPEGASLVELRDRAEGFGLQECPLELGPYLRLRYTDQIEQEEKNKNKAPLGSVTIISKPLMDDDDFPKGFYLRRMDGALWLRGYLCSSDYLWNPGDRIVFQIR